jgi:hypothetical protein
LISPRLSTPIGTNNLVSYPSGELERLISVDPSAASSGTHMDMTGTEAVAEADAKQTQPPRGYCVVKRSLKDRVNLCVVQTHGMI